MGRVQGIDRPSIQKDIRSGGSGSLILRPCLGTGWMVVTGVRLAYADACDFPHILATHLICLDIAVLLGLTRGKV